MTRDDIIRMAREAGYQHPDAVGTCEDFAYFDLYRFAALVAAAVEQNTSLTWANGLLEAVRAEREACAKMIEDAPALVKFATNDRGGCLVCGFTPKLAAAAIRARGDTT